MAHPILEWNPHKQKQIKNILLWQTSALTKNSCKFVPLYLSDIPNCFTRNLQRKKFYDILTRG